MRIGILPSFNQSGGGIYQYSLAMLEALHLLQKQDLHDEFVLFYRDQKLSSGAGLIAADWPRLSLYGPRAVSSQILDMLRNMVGEGPHREAWRSLRRKLSRKRNNDVNYPDPDMVRFRPEVGRWFRRCELEFMIYCYQHAFSFESGLPYMMAIHDVQHRLQPEFHEVSANGVWEQREYVFRNGSRFATLILADSEIGKEDILSFYSPYGLTADKVKILPFLPPFYLGIDIGRGEQERVKSIYHLPERYLFYPAQFWPHKNHARIVQALGLLKEEHCLSIPIAFCGSYSGEIRERAFQEVMSLAHKLRVEDQIHYLGCVPDEDMSGLYGGATALVMPTFFGPTNIPVLEAWAFGCPVLTSDIRGIREQAGDAAILVDPRSVEAIANGIYQLWIDDNLRFKLAVCGKQRLANYTPNDYRRRLKEILEEAKDRVRSERRRNNI